MIVPSIDIANGEAVQLIGGREQALKAGDPLPLARNFGRVGEVAVIDLDAALSQGSNAEQIRDLLPLVPCRVGGGIREVSTAIGWLDAGAHTVIFGTAATPQVLSDLPKDRVIAAHPVRMGIEAHSHPVELGSQRLSDPRGHVRDHQRGTIEGGRQVRRRREGHGSGLRVLAAA